LLDPLGGCGPHASTFGRVGQRQQLVAPQHHWRPVGEGILSTRGSPVMTFAVIAPISRVGLRSRLVKMMPVLLAKGFDPVFYGWERVRGEATSAEGGLGREHVILRGGGHSTRGARFMYPLWM